MDDVHRAGDTGTATLQRGPQPSQHLARHPMALSPLRPQALLAPRGQGGPIRCRAGKGVNFVGSLRPLALHVCPSTEPQANLALFAVQVKGLIIAGSINSLALNVCPSIQANLALFAVHVKGLIIVGSINSLALNVCPSIQANLALFAVQVKGLIIVGSIHSLALHVCSAGKGVNYGGFHPSYRSPGLSLDRRSSKSCLICRVGKGVCEFRTFALYVDFRQSLKRILPHLPCR